MCKPCTRPQLQWLTAPVQDTPPPHVPRYSPTLLQGYQLGPSQLDFAITITITSTTASGAPLTETLTLDPSNPYVLDDANLVSAQLLGDLLTYTALPVFTDTYLMVPSPTGVLPHSS